MFGLSKIQMYVIGALLVLLLGALAATKLLWSELAEANVKIGSLESAMKSVVQTSNENVAAWDIERKALMGEVQTHKDLAALAQKASRDAQAEEALHDRALQIAMNTIKETGHASPEVEEWSVVAIPDAVVDSMCIESARATGEAAECDGEHAGGHRDPGEAPRAVPDRAAPATQ